MTTRVRAVVAIAIISGAISATAETQPPPSGATGNDSESAYQKGRADAENDLKNNRLTLESFGLPAPYFGEYTRLLRERYHLELRQVAGCVPDGRIIGHARGYNEVSMKEIERRYGKDILEQAGSEANKRYQATRQK
jgi:hypothetical protein